MGAAAAVGGMLAADTSITAGAAVAAFARRSSLPVRGDVTGGDDVGNVLAGNGDVDVLAVNPIAAITAVSTVSTVAAGPSLAAVGAFTAGVTSLAAAPALLDLLTMDASEVDRATFDRVR